MRISTFRQTAAISRPDGKTNTNRRNVTPEVHPCDLGEGGFVFPKPKFEIGFINVTSRGRT